MKAKIPAKSVSKENKAIVKQNKRSRKQYFSRLFGILNSRFKRHTQTAVGGFRSNLSKRVNNWTNRESLSRDKNLQISE